MRTVQCPLFIGIKATKHTRESNSTCTIEKISKKFHFGWRQKQSMDNHGFTIFSPPIILFTKMSNLGIHLWGVKVPEISYESSLIIFTRSRLNLWPEKLHSEGNANKLYVLPVAPTEKRIRSCREIKWLFFPLNLSLLYRGILKMKLNANISKNFTKCCSPRIIHDSPQIKPYIVDNFTKMGHPC